MAERQFRDAREKPIKRGCLAGDKQIGELAGRVRLCDTESVIRVVCVRTVEREVHLLPWQRLPLNSLPGCACWVATRCSRIDILRWVATFIGALNAPKSPLATRGLLISRLVFP